MKRSLLLIGLAAIGILYGNLSSTAAPPNVLLVLTDDQGYGDFSCHGNPVLKTPYLDKLHAQSVRFVDFHVSPMCTPTRGQLMTGQDALHNGATCVCSGRTFIRPGTPTMADLFADAGYRTAIFGKWHLGDNYPHRPNDRGFQEAVYHFGWGITSTPDYWNNDYFDDYFQHNGRLQKYPGYCTDVWFAECRKWIDNGRQQGKPFFAYLALNAPHGPFFVPPKYRQQYSQVDHETAGFFGMIANLDENLARLDAWLAETGLRDNTILVFLTDNGGTGGVQVYNAGMRGAKASLYEGGHRTPCFIRWPAGGLRAAGDLRGLTEVQDLLPTLLDLCGVKPTPQARFDGQSLARLLRGQEQPDLTDRKLVVQYGGLVRADAVKWDCAVLWQHWRLVKGRELYDLQNDPEQKTDVAASHPEVVETLRKHYERWWSRVEPGLNEPTRITIGSNRENPSRLTSMDWWAPGLVVAAQDYDVRQLGKSEEKIDSLPGGRPQVLLNGHWNLQVARAGSYQIVLRRWPQEAGTPITAGLPPLKVTDGKYPAGRALPIAKARLRIGGSDQTKTVAANDKGIEFTVQLNEGPVELQTWFYDAAGKEICGAFYVDVLRR